MSVYVAECVCACVSMYMCVCDCVHAYVNVCHAEFPGGEIQKPREEEGVIPGPGYWVWGRHGGDRLSTAGGFFPRGYRPPKPKARGRSCEEKASTAEQAAAHLQQQSLTL